MNILFRADSSSTIGTGHIMRDLVLAKQYPKSNIIFATQNLDGNINHKILEVVYKIEPLNSNDIKELDKLIKKLNIDMIIIDHYSIDWKYEKQLSILNSQLSIMVLDDTYEKHHCDILLNHNIYANPKKYKNKVPKKCELRCGAKYTLLRDEFIQAKKEKKKKKFSTLMQSRKNEDHSQLSIFVAMGGADSANLNIKILKVLEKFEYKTIVVTTKANKNLKKLQNYCKDKSWIELQIDSNKIAKLMGKSNFGIITPSVTANELYFMNIPFITIKTADNQKEMVKFLKKKQYLTMDKFNKNKLNQFIKKLLF